MREVQDILSFTNLTKTYSDGTVAVKDFSLEMKRGEFVVLIGPSGCGKSTTLRMVNRLIEPSSGTIKIDGQDVKTYHPVELRRRLGYVIQQVGLIPHLTIAENISFVLRLKGVKENDRRIRAKQLLELVGMSPEVYLDRYPAELSGGQQQRIGVLRALAHDPDIILMDEPFGALDPITREQLQDELKRLQRSVHKTILFVTHDMDEALRMADRIVMMLNGMIIQVASPEQILRAPAEEFVVNFIGRQRIMRQATESKIGEVMANCLPAIPAGYSLAQSVELMVREGVNNLVTVEDSGKFQGLVFLDEAQRALAAGDDRPVGALARLRDVCVQPDSSVLWGIHLMLTHMVDAVPLTAPDGIVAGVVTRRELVGLLNDVARATGADLGTGDKGRAGDGVPGKVVS